MKKTQEIITFLKENNKNVKFSVLVKLCEYYFGKPRQNGSHLIFKTPWFGDPRINIQNKNNQAKPYQIRQVLLAIDKLEELKNEKNKGFPTKWGGASVP